MKRFNAKGLPAGHSPYYKVNKYGRLVYSSTTVYVLHSSIKVELDLHNIEPAELAYSVIEVCVKNNRTTGFDEQHDLNG